MSQSRLNASRCECGRPKTKGAEACPRCLRIDSTFHHAIHPTGRRRRRQFINVAEADRAFSKWLTERGLEK